MSVKARDLAQGSPIKFFKVNKDMDEGNNKHFIFIKRVDKSFHPSREGLLGLRVTNNDAEWQFSSFSSSFVYGWDKVDTVPSVHQRKVLQKVLEEDWPDFTYKHVK